MRSLRQRPMPESLVVQIWEQKLGSQQTLQTSNGDPVDIIYPGRPNDGRGADFKDAVIETGGINRSGCIEIHSRFSGWHTHGHHLDPVYNQVILHVAMEKDKPGNTVLQDGRDVPTIILEQNTGLSLPGRRGNKRILCQKFDFSLRFPAMLAALGKAGDIRLLEKAARYRRDLDYQDAEQSLYAGLTEALGYHKNKVPFLELSRLVPISRLTEIIKRFKTEEECIANIQAILLGYGGFLSSQPPVEFIAGTYYRQLQRIWFSCHDSKEKQPLKWELFKVRPTNHPVRRILALSHLLYRLREKGLPDTLLSLLLETKPVDIRRILEEAVIVKDSGVELDQACLMGVHEHTSVSLLGHERAQEIIINVVLPYFYAWSLQTSDSELRENVMDIYHRYPCGPTNSIERHMFKQLGLKSHQISRACLRQGLIHIFKALCSQGKCEHCSLCQVAG